MVNKTHPERWPDITTNSVRERNLEWSAELKGALTLSAIAFYCHDPSITLASPTLIGATKARVTLSGSRCGDFDIWCKVTLSDGQVAEARVRQRVVTGGVY